MLYGMFLISRHTWHVGNLCLLTALRTGYMFGIGFRLSVKSTHYIMVTKYKEPFNIRCIYKYCQMSNKLDTFVYGNTRSL